MTDQARLFDDRLGLYNPSKTYIQNWDEGPFPPKGFKPYQDKGEPQYEFLGVPINSPFGIPAGPLLNSNHVKFAFEAGFDVLCYKTQRSIKFLPNEFPNVLYLDIEDDLTLDRAKKPLIGKRRTDKPLERVSITNSFGNPSLGPAFWVEDLKKALAYEKKGQLLIMSVVGTIQEGFTQDDYYNDFAEAAKQAALAGVKAIEINLSCPNVASEGILCYTKEAVVEVCKRTKEAIGGVPLITKFGYFSQSQENQLEETLSEISPFVAAISAINTLPAPVVGENGKQALPGEGRLSSGICGASIKWAGLDMVRRLKKLNDKNKWGYEIIGVGGVMNTGDFHEYRKAGADVVQSATAAMWNTALAKQIKTSL
jgi:dihydroorotate dehydrogenase